MWSLPTTVLDWCFPPREDEFRVRNLTISDLTSVPYHPTENITCLLPFHHPHTRALVHEAKFFYNTRAHRLLGTVLAQHAATLPTPHIFIPIPLHWKRKQKRGFNQVTACLRTHRTIARHTNTRLLKRRVATKPQTSLSAEERLSNVENAFTVSHRFARSIPPETHLILVDDVYTTGATLQSAMSVLSAAVPNPVTSIALTYA